MKNIKHLFFDLDHTLWDFDKNSAETLAFLFDKYRFNQLHQMDMELFIAQYHQVNRDLWELFNHNKINKHQLREQRIQQTFNNLGVEIQHIPATFNEEYISICPQKGNLFPHTIEILAHFSESHQLHILSNGFADIQAIKIASSGLAPYFKTIFTADTIGAKKPNRAFYNHVLHHLKTIAPHCLMVGDTLDADVIGAMNVGIKAVYFNPYQTTHNAKVDFEIQSLLALKDIFK